MNVLGVTFDSRLNWNDHVAQTIKKTNSALHCIRQIKYYFNPNELLQIITSNVYSIMYYNSEIWNIPTLHCEAKQKLLSISANALKICTPTYQDKMCVYGQVMVLYKLIETQSPIADWIDLNHQQSFNRRDTYFKFFRLNNYRVGCNNICNRMSLLNGKLPLSSVDKSFDSFKVQCKQILLGT